MAHLDHQTRPDRVRSIAAARNWTYDIWPITADLRRAAVWLARAVELKARMGATHFLTKTLPKVAAEMALSVLAYNLTRVMNIVGTKPLMAAIVA
jgi:hypothetical protein